MPKVSIIIPTYNSEIYIKSCIDSILNQTYNDFEILIYDGCSTDKTTDIINKYIKSNSNIKLNIKKDGGPGEARNTGIKDANGDYIIFIDADDMVDKNYIETFINGIENTQYDIVIGGYKLVKNGKIKKEVILKNKKIEKYLHIGPWGRIIRREFLIKNNIPFPKIKTREDSYFNCLIYNTTDKIGYIQYTGYNYTINNTSSMTNTLHHKFDSNFLKRLELLKTIKPLDNENGIMLKYFILRSSILYLLYSGMFVSSKEFIQEYNKIFSTLGKEYLKNKYISLLKYSENSFLYKLIIRGFIQIKKLHAITLFSKVWCKIGNTLYKIS